MTESTIRQIPFSDAAGSEKTLDDYGTDVVLVVNVASAAVLIPHRTGDANVRAVWLFSRNDAIGNAAVVLAALLVAWTASPWPDLAVAVVIAGLFLHSAWSIVRDARSDLREASA